MSKLNIDFNKDTDTFRTFFGDEELQKENMKLYNVLVKAVENIHQNNYTIVLVFKGKVVAAITHIEFDIFNIAINDSSLYEYEDHEFTKMSKDRILHYLDYIANVVLLEA